MSISNMSAAATVEQQETAALAAMDLAAPLDAASVPKQLVAEMREAVWLLAETLTPVAPAPSFKSLVLSRVAQFEQLKPQRDVRRSEEHWVSAGMPGIDIKTLFQEDETGRSTYLVRMQPGVRFPTHYHHDPEQCLVLKGDLCWGDLVYEEGDFILMDKGTEHPEIHTVHGNLLLIVAGHNEFLVA